MAKMAKKKGDKKQNKKEAKQIKQKTTKSKSIFLILIGVLVVLFIVSLSFDFGKDDTGSSNNEVKDALGILSDSCLNYAKNSLRADFCKYYLVGDELLTCSDSRIISYIQSNGVDTSISSLNCRNIDNYYYRKTACELLAPGRPEIKIDNTTCGYYK